MASRWQEQKRLFTEACDLAPGERGAFLESACEDPELRAEVLELLEADTATGDPIVGSLERAAAEVAPIPEFLGGYRIVGRLGSGGMGQVFEAEQENPRRRVAIKTLHGGAFADPMRLGMFRREARSLGRLEHPGIARIYEAGRTDEGQDYLVLELVRGRSLREWLADGPSRDERLDLFCEIGEAVAHAHRRGILHRDLKPSNIHVDAEGRAKVLDFGLARIEEDEGVGTATYRTALGQVQGTLAYMSPEQAQGDPAGVDVRSDVYSLGVLLYEMLTDRSPYDLAEKPWSEALRVVQENPPRRPTRFVPDLDGDLETIVLHALEKDPARRYASVDALVDDVRRFRGARPIVARPASRAYVFRKFVARHRAASIAVGALLVALVAGVVVSTKLYLEAEHARRATASERDRADREARSAREVTDWMIDLFAAADPGESLGEEITAKQLLAEGAERADALEGEPLQRARLLEAIGRAQKGSGALPDAKRHLADALEIRREELGSDDPETVENLLHLADVLYFLGEEGDEELIREAIESRTRRLGADDPLTLEARARLAGNISRRGDYAGALALQKEVHAAQEKLHGPADLRTLDSLATIGRLHMALGEPEAAFAAGEKVLAGRRAALDARHPDVLAARSDLALYLEDLGRIDDAVSVHREVIELQRQVLGPDHLDTLSSLGNLALLLLEDGRVDEAEPLFEELREGFARTLGEASWAVLLTDFHLGQVHLERGRFAEAEASIRSSFGDGPSGDALWAGNVEVQLARAVAGQGRLDEAEAMMRDGLETIQGVTGRGVDGIRIERDALEALADLLEAAGRPEEAAPLRARAAELDARL